MSFTGLLVALTFFHGPASQASVRELFPGVRADLAARVVEFDATTSPLLMKDDRAPLFFLETIVCSPDTREHETLLVSTTRPSHIHAALLAIGLQPGTPGAFKFENNALIPIQPTGPGIHVEFVYTAKSGPRVTADPLDWIINVKDGTSFYSAEAKIKGTPPALNTQPLVALPPGPRFLFTGSKVVNRKDPATGQLRDVYDADGSGTIIGLTTFGSEVIGWERVISPDAQVEDPQWIADFTKTPPPNTPVTVRIRERK